MINSIFFSLIHAVPEVTILEPVQTSFIILSGHSVCLPCELSHQFDMSPVRWKFGERVISHLTDSRFEVMSNGSLCINNANISHTGSYFCLAESDRLEHTVTVIGGCIM